MMMKVTAVKTPAGKRFLDAHAASPLFFCRPRYLAMALASPRA